MDDAERHARLDAWFRAYGDRVLGYLCHRTDPDTAQDVLQEVFVTAFRRSADVPEPPLGWLLGTARRTLANSSRGARRRDRLVLRLVTATSTDDRLDLHGGDGDVAAHTAVRAALEGLPLADREVLTLSAWYELTAKEAAEALGCTPAAYAVRLHRARRRLAERLTRTDADHLEEAVND